MAVDATTKALSELLDRVLSEPDLKLKLESRAAMLGAKIKWPSIAKQYATLAEGILKSKMAIQCDQETWSEAICLSRQADLSS